MLVYATLHITTVMLCDVVVQIVHGVMVDACIGHITTRIFPHKSQKSIEGISGKYNAVRHKLPALLSVEASCMP